MLSDTALFRRVIDAGATSDDAGPRQLGQQIDTRARAFLPIDWPAGLEPLPAPLDEEPSTDDPLPSADVVVVCWTAAEWRALADVLTPGVSGPSRWYRYTRGYETYLPAIRKGAPARNSKRLAAYHPFTIGNRRCLAVKSELHLNQDGVRTGDGTATLPVADLFRQIIAETKPKLVITTGTCGGAIPSLDLGDVLITRGAAFECDREFRNEAFAKALYTCPQRLKRKHLTTARGLMAAFADRIVEPDFAAPTPRYAWTGDPIPGPSNRAGMKIDGDDFAEFHPILSADWFLFGTTTNDLGERGCGVEMGDAVLGMVCEELGAAAPKWLVVRNVSNPVVNGLLDPRVMAMWSGFYYDTYGYWTSVNSAIACWAMIAP